MSSHNKRVLEKDETMKFPHACQLLEMNSQAEKDKLTCRTELNSAI